MAVFEIQGYLQLIVLVAMLGVKGFAFVNSLSWSAQAYDAAGKLTKQAWTIGLGLGFAAQVLLMGSSPLNLIHMVFIIAALVYLADVRPALAEVMGRRSR